MEHRRFGVLAYIVMGSVVSFAGALASACSDDTSSGAGSGGGTTGSGGATSTGTGGGGGGGGGGPAQTVDCAPPAGADGALKLTQVAAGVDQPLLVKGAPGDLDRLFILTQAGEIRILKDGTVQPAPFLDIKQLVIYNGERGLLGLAFHPGYAQNGRFFVHYSDGATGATRIAEYKRGADADTADPNQVAMVLMQDQPQPNHNGGSIEFSPTDGFLYIGLGDGGNAGDQGPGHSPIGNGQDTSTLLGKILRIDVSTTPYSIPAGNLTGAGVLPEIWDYGMRNPYRFSFDACTGDLYIGDVGQDDWEEIDIEPAGQGNKNYGWRVMEGTHCFPPGSNCDQAGLTLPAAEYQHTGPTCGGSVTGGYVYRGSAIPWLRGTYFYGDYCSGRVWTLRYDGDPNPSAVERTQELGTAGMNIVGFGQDSRGEVYLTNDSGAIFRIEAQ